MLECRRCKHEDCDFKKEIFNAIKAIGNYTDETVVYAIEDMIVRATEDCQDFESIE